jgi:hypothetical protein
MCVHTICVCVCVCMHTYTYAWNYVFLLDAILKSYTHDPHVYHTCVLIHVVQVCVS